MIEYQSHDLEDSPFSTLVVDITHRCNMACANCYLPNRSIDDLSLDRVVAALEKLPRRTNIRLAGAEPTLHPDLFEMIRRIRAAGHRVTLLTNGLRLSRRTYVDELKASGLRHVYISMNGVDRDDWYLALDNLECAAKKTRALENCINAGMVVNTGTILVPGLNDDAPGRLLALISERKPKSAVLRFKNVGAIGRYMNGSTPRFEFKDLVVQVASQLGINPDFAWEADWIEGKRERLTRFFPFVRGTRPGSGIWVKVTGWDNAGGSIDAGSTRRGRLTPEMKVAPFFEHVLANEGGY